MSIKASPLTQLRKFAKEIDKIKIKSGVPTALNKLRNDLNSDEDLREVIYSLT